MLSHSKKAPNDVSYIHSMPTVLDTQDAAYNGGRVHESILRAYNILEKVKHLLRIDTPAEVILEIIDLCESGISEENQD